MSEPHVHAWRLQFHIDGCHYFASGYTCECGATRAEHGERDLDSDPYGSVWFLDDCERCKELMTGSKPMFTDEIVLPGQVH